MIIKIVKFNNLLIQQNPTNFFINKNDNNFNKITNYANLRLQQKIMEVINFTKIIKFFRIK